MSVEGKVHSILLPIKDRVYEFNCEDEEEAKKWESALASHFNSGGEQGAKMAAEKAVQEFKEKKLAKK